MPGAGAPGLNFIYVHLNRVLNVHQAEKARLDVFVWMTKRKPDRWPRAGILRRRTARSAGRARSAASTTAVLLFTQFSLLRLRVLLVLTIAYLFTAFVVFVHMLTFPRPFAPQGLLVASLQTTGWLYPGWYVSFPAAVIAYVQLNHGSGAKRKIDTEDTAETKVQKLR